MNVIAMRLLAVLVLIVSNGRVAAQTSWPAHDELYINDLAGLLDEASAQTLRDQLRQLHEQLGIEMTVVTIERRSDYGYRGSMEPFATGLFNHWGIGNASRNDGLMLLVSRSDRDVRIELGAGYPGSADRVASQVIDNTLLPRFRQGDFTQGIVEGVMVLTRLVRSGQLSQAGAVPTASVDPVEASIPTLDRIPAYAGADSDPSTSEFSSRRSDSDSGIPGWLLALAGVPGIGLLVFYVRRYLRRKPRACSNCQRMMVRLDETDEDEFLEDAKELEERIRSVDYDVWQCPDCEHMTIQRYPAWFSSYGACSQCNYRTLESDTTTIRSASYTSTGRKRIDYLCLNCNHQYEEYKTIPMKTRSSSSSSSSSSSFGGGSSSGGGASGSW